MSTPLNRRQVLGSAAALAAPALLPAHVLAQDKYPNRPITLIAPWPTGGSSDAVMRAFAESAGKAMGATIVVENKPGAGGTLGASAMVNAKPDGYTLTQLPLGIYRLPHMQTMTFDPVKDLTHIVCLTGYTFGIACTADAPFKTLKEMVAYAKANPGKLEYGHTGTGTTPHLAIEEFSDKAGIQLNPIPFKGSAEIMQAILGKLRLLATLGRQRNKAFPDVPTVKESGWDTITESPFGIGGPKGMDPAIVKVLHDGFRKTLEDPAVLATLDKFFQPVIYMNSADYQAYGERTFKAEKATIERLGLAKKA